MILLFGKGNVQTKARLVVTVSDVNCEKTKKTKKTKSEWKDETNYM
jgi:hypothetical protein